MGTKIPYKSESKPCYHTMQGEVNKPIPNLIVYKGNKRYRVRAELILFKEGKILLSLLDKPSQYGTTYKLPGGGIDSASEDIEEAATRECEEEVRIKPKNVKYTGVEWSGLYKKIPDWHKKCLHPDGIYYDGYISFICTGEYDKAYNGYVKVVDRDDKQKKNSEFYSYDEIKDKLHPIHKKIIDNYLKNQSVKEGYYVTEATNDYKVKGSLLFKKLTQKEKEQWSRSCPRISNVKTGPGIIGLIIIKLYGFGRTKTEYTGEVAGFVTCDSKGTVLDIYENPKAKSFHIKKKLLEFSSKVSRK